MTTYLNTKGREIYTKGSCSQMYIHNSVLLKESVKTTLRVEKLRMECLQLSISLVFFIQ